MINNIQVLRCIAASLVVLHHSIHYGKVYGYETELFYYFKGWGQCGVDIFFVISGFIMVVTQENRKRSALSFMWQRLKRIVPIYWFSLSLILSIYLLAPSIFNNLEIGGLRAIASYFFSSKLVTGIGPIVGVGWTLEYEMLFYLVFSASLLVGAGLLRYLFVFISLVLFSLLEAYEAIIFEFVFGMLAGLIYSRSWLPGSFNAKKTGACLIVLGLMGLLSSLMFWEGVERVLVWGTPAFLIVLGVLYVEQARNKFLVFLGDASYSIYLFHWFFIPAFYKVMVKVSPSMEPVLVIVFCVFMSLLVGAIMHMSVERPLSFLVNKFEFLFNARDKKPNVLAAESK